MWFLPSVPAIPFRAFCDQACRLGPGLVASPAAQVVFVIADIAAGAELAGDERDLERERGLDV
jgi:hypothetical protein